jgi:manganese/zinc/iron transport system substrate-binding protein
LTSLRFGPDRRSVLFGMAAAAVLPTASRAQDPVAVVATTGMIADAARVVGGDRVLVKALMGPGVDPHAYRQTRSDIAALFDADLVLWHGLYLEAQIEEFLLDLAARTRVVALADRIAQEQLLAHDDYPDRFDPHVWMDPDLWAEVIKATAEALSEVDPEGAALYAGNAAAAIADASELMQYSRDVLATVPTEARILVTAHDAFNYFGRAFGWDVEGLQGISTQSEAGVQRVQSLVDMIVGRRIGAVFVESSVSDRAVRALIEGAAAQGHTLTIGGELYSDAMGPDGTYEGTWAGMIDHNVTTIARALGGVADAGGRLGKLAVE